MVLLMMRKGGRDLDSKTKKTIFVASAFLAVIVILSLFYHVNRIKTFESKTGSYFYKIDILSEGNTKGYQWNIGIDKNNNKSGIVENESNGKTLEKFRDTVGGITNKRLELFLATVYLLFVLIMSVSAQKDGQISKSNKEQFQLFAAVLVVFLICIISIFFVGLNGLYQDISFYYSAI
jgi:hypothetical protein